MLSFEMDTSVIVRQLFTFLTELDTTIIVIVRQCPVFLFDIDSAVQVR